MARFIKIQAILDRFKLDKELEKLKNEKVNINVNTTGNQTINNTNNSINNLNNTAKFSSKIFTELRLRMTSYLAVLRVAIASIKGAISSIKELDDAVTDLASAMGSGRAAAFSYLKELNKYAQQLGATTTEVSESADSWLRQGKTVAETESLIKDSLVLSKVAKIKSADATTYLTSALNGYKLEASDAIGIIDKLTAVDLESASDAGGLAVSLSKTASAANMAGVSIEKLIGYIATVKEVSQDSDSSVGNMFKSVFSRLNQVKAGKFIDLETGEALNDVEKVLNKIGVSLRDTNNEFKNSELVLDELGAKWQSYDDVTQRALATTIAGTYQYNKFISLMDNYGNALNYTTIAQESSGTAMDKFKSYEESLESQSKTLQASLESLAFNTFGTDIYSNVLKASTALVQFIEKTNALKFGIAAFSTMGVSKLLTNISLSIVSTTRKLSEFSLAMDIIKSQDIIVYNFDALLRATQGLSASQTKLVLSSKMLSHQQRINILTNQGLSIAEAESMLATLGLTASTNTLSAALKGLWRTMLANPVVMIVAGLAAALYASYNIWDCFNVSLEEATESLKEAKQEFSSIQSEINSLESELETCTSKLEELQKLADSGSITLIEQEELDRLKDTNEELERRLRAEKERRQLAAIEVAKSASDTVNATVQSKYEIEWITGTRDAYASKTVTAPEELELAIEEYQRLAEEIDALNQQYDNSEINVAEYTSQLNTLTKKQLNARNHAAELNEKLSASEQAFADLVNVGGILTQQQENEYTIVQKSAKGYDNFISALQGVIETVEKIQNITEETKSLSIEDVFSLKDSDNNATALSDLKDKLGEVEKAYATCLDAKTEYDEQGYLSYDTLSKLIELGDDYLKYIFDEEGQVRLDADAFRELADARLEELRAQALQNLADNIKQITDEAGAAEYLANKQLELANSYENVAASALRAMTSISGFADSGALQSVYNEFKTQYDQINSLFANTKKGLESTYDGKIKSKSSSDPLKDAFTQEYNTLKHNLEMEYITEKQYYESLAELNQKYFAGKKKYIDEYRKYEEEVYKGLQKYYTAYIEDQMNLLEKQLDAGVINYQHYSSTIKSLIKSMYNDGKISAENYHKYMQQMLEKQLDIYDKVLSAVKRRFDKEIDYYDKLIDGIEKQNDALEDQLDMMDSAISAVVNYYDELIDKQYEMADELEKQNDAISKQISEYDSLLNVVERVYSAEQDKLKEQQNAIQERIDALNDESSAYDLLYRKEQALYELQRSQSQRTQKVYVAGKGVVYNTDQNAIREADKNLANIKTEELVNQLEKEKEALQKSIDALDEWKNKWAEISDVYNQLVEERIAIDLLGAEYESRILSNRLEDIEYFKEQYISSNQQIDDNTAMIDSYNEKAEYYENLKNQWSELTNSLQKEVDNQIAVEVFGAEWEKRINEGRFNEYASFRDQYLSVQNQINDNTTLIDSYNEKITYYNGLKDQWSDIADAYNQSMEDQYAAMVLGQNWESDILSDRLDTLNDFKNDYNKIQQQIVDFAWQSANEQIKAAQEAEKGAKGTQGSAGSVKSSTNTSSGTTTTTTSTKKLEYVVIDSTSGGVIREGFSTSEAAKSWVTAKKLVYPNAIISFKKYARGGIVGSSTTPLDFLASSMGEDHMIAAKEGERVLTPEQNAIWEKWTEHIPRLVQMNSFVPQVSPELNLPSQASRAQQPVEVTNHINVTMPNVTNTGGVDNFTRFIDNVYLDSIQYASKRS